MNSSPPTTRRYLPAHEVADVRFLHGLPQEVRASGRKDCLEIADGLPRAFVQPRLNLVNQHVAGPAIFDGGSRVPEADFGIAELLHECNVVIPGQL